MAEDWVQIVGGPEVLSRVKIPQAGVDRVYKDECVYSFDTPETDTGLFISLTSFWGLGKDHVESYYRRTGNPLFLHIHRIKRKVPKPQVNEGPEKKITRLAIGVEGGFDNGQDFTYEIEEFYHLVIFPSFRMVKLPNDQLPEIILKSIAAIQSIESASKLAELEALAGTWEGDIRVTSRHSEGLTQLDNGKKVSPKGWKCEIEGCGLAENLWLNLTDGTILCGRKFFDGTGGNNHAKEHFDKYHYPLAVKLGTITPDGRADVYSYDEDDMVIDTKLVDHLAHFGINIAVMEKTDKSMLEMEIELNQKQGEWDVIQEAGKKLQPIHGPGFTGLVNLGNSCYLNSVMQVLFSIPAFEARFLNNASKYFESSADPVNDFNVQMSKMCVGLLSGKYSSKDKEDAEGIRPIMFRTLIGRGHQEFATKKQQDAQEFFLHLLSALEKNSRNEINPADCFKFQVEDKLICRTSGRVRYTNRTECCIPFAIPMDKATNKTELLAFEQAKKSAEEKGISENLVRPRIPFEACLEEFAAVHEVECLIPGGGAINSMQTRLATFPDYMAVQLQKFQFAQDWTPVKLDVSVDMPDELDISCLRAHGLQPGEVLLPEVKKQTPPVDESVVQQLTEMGFNPNASLKAVILTGNKGLQDAMDWVMLHLDDPDINSPYGEGSQSSQTNLNWVANEEGVKSIEAMGFTSDQARKALQATNNNVERAVDWIFSHVDELDTIASNPPNANTATTTQAPRHSDGPGKYQLIGFISHMGTSTMVGHYVCHILKNGKWVIFNDSKVAASENLPKDLGYLYFYKRLQ